MSYMAAHNKVRRVRGSARNYRCVDCDARAREWAYLKGSAGELVDESGRRYSKDPSDYQPMCYRCHRLLDKSSITHCPKGHPYEGPNLIWDGGKRKCKPCVYARNAERSRRGLTLAQRARKSKLQRQRRASAREAAA